MTVRWGILGPGRISRAFRTGLAGLEGATAVAVASRVTARARAFADEFGVPRAYGSYADLLADPAVDAVYIGLPNGMHPEWSIAAARAGKHVLCEKPLAATEADAEAMFGAAREAGVWLMEAFMYRFHPRTRRLAELVADGAVGPVRAVQGSMGFTVGETANTRLSAELAGGAALDVGCYPVSLARMVIGARPAHVFAAARWADAGVDAALAGSLDYPGGELGQVYGSMFAADHQTAVVIGSEGMIQVPVPFGPPPDGPTRLVITRGDSRVEETFGPVDQYRLEAKAFGRLIAAGHDVAGLPEMPLVESLDNAATIEALLHSARDGRRVSLQGAVAGRATMPG